METNKLKSIKISLMELQSDIDEKTSKAEYIIKASGEFKVNEDFFEALDNNEEQSLLEGLVEGIYNDLLQKNPDVDIDTIGMWIDYDEKIYENAIKIDTLKDMEEYSVDSINPVYEFFKMTLDV